MQYELHFELKHTDDEKRLFEWQAMPRVVIMQDALTGRQSHSTVLSVTHSDEIITFDDNESMIMESRKQQTDHLHVNLTVVISQTMIRRKWYKVDMPETGIFSHVFLNMDDHHLYGQFIIRPSCLEKLVSVRQIKSSFFRVQTSYVECAPWPSFFVESLAQMEEPEGIIAR
jgi:hypothetical protein